MNEKAINSLNKTLTIHFPIDNWCLYAWMDLDDKGKFAVKAIHIT